MIPETSSEDSIRRINYELQTIIRHIERDISACRSPSIVILSKSASSSNRVILSFPGKCQSEGIKFTMYLRIISILIQRLDAKARITLRDIYYLDVELFSSPIVVSRLVNDIGYTLGVTRRQLGVVSSRKGLVAGSMAMHFKSGNIVQTVDSSHGVLIPVLDDIDYLELQHIEFILILEKEAVYQTLCSLDFYKPSHNRGNGLIITGKGYPDLLTREFIYYISIHFSYIPIFAAVDADPFGLHILSIYQNGSYSRSNLENSFMATSTIQWIGIYLQDILFNENDGLLLTCRDRKIALMLLNDSRHNNKPDIWRCQLQRMLFLGKKGEMNVACQNGASSSQERIDALGISTYIESKLVASLKQNKIDDLQ